jgi:hypothetical protein
MCSLVNAGYTFERIAPLFQSSRHESHLDPAKRDFLKRLEAEYLRARELPDTAAVKAAREFAEQVKVWALNAHSITGNLRTRETDRRVLLAHVDVVQRTGRLEWHLSRRDIEKAAQVSKPTAQQAQKRLQDSSIIVRSQTHRVSYATKWTFGAGVRQLTHSLTLRQTVWVSGQVQAHATFEQGGLGRNLARTFAAMVDAPMTENEIASATGFKVRTVARHIAILVRHELAAARAGGKWQALPANLDDVAYSLGTTSIAHRRAKRIERERQQHRRSLARKLQTSAHEHFQSAPQVAQDTDPSRK